jgi:predicted small metal-binding protein
VVDREGPFPFFHNACVRYSREVHISEAHNIKCVAENTSIPAPNSLLCVSAEGVTYIVMSRIKGRPARFGWRARHADSKQRILDQLKVHIQELRSLAPPKAEYVGALEGCYTYDMKIPAYHGDSNHRTPFPNFHRHIRKNID